MTVLKWFERLSDRTVACLLALIVVLAGALRFWHIGSRPGYDWDEPVYTNIAAHVAAHGSLTLTPELGESNSPYLFHPPFYFLMMGGWFKLFGSGVTQARVWAAIMSLIALLLFYCLLRTLLGRGIALACVMVLTTDGWMIFTNRVSWIENTLVVLIALALWLYARAISSASTVRFVIAGLAFGGVAVFKHLGLYILIAVLINWAIRRGNRRGHQLLMAVAASVIVAYVVAMLFVFNRSGHNYFWDDSVVQVRRTLGLQPHRGTINTPTDFVQPLFEQYRVFVGTMALAVTSGVLVLVRLCQCILSRSWTPVRVNSLLFSWAVAALLCFGAMDLKFPHYFVMVFIPLAFYLISEVGLQLQRTRRVASLRVAFVGLLVVALLGLASFGWRIAGHTDNALKQTQQYAEAHIPTSAVVVTEQTIGSLIPQQYCNFDRTSACAKEATYLITYVSFTEHLSDDATFRALLQHSTAVDVITGFKETITVYKINS